jgi:hypothetical protein
MPHVALLQLGLATVAATVWLVSGLRWSSDFGLWLSLIVFILPGVAVPWGALIAIDVECSWWTRRTGLVLACLSLLLSCGGCAAFVMNSECNSW